jgi:hypothetical protein
MRCCLIFIFNWSLILHPSLAFLVAPSVKHKYSATSAPCAATKHPSATGTEETMDDQALLAEVTTNQLVDLCQQCRLPETGSKEEMLKRLRDYALQQAQVEHDERLKRKERIENGDFSNRERYEIVTDENPDEADEDDEGVFYYALPESVPINMTVANTKTRMEAPDLQFTNQYDQQAPIPNEQGERVVTIYSTTDENDMTGIAAAQPGQAARGGDSLSTAQGTTQQQPWDMQKSTKGKATNEQVELAKEKVTALVQTLLASTGAPAFSSYGDDDEIKENMYGYNPPANFVGFNPSTIPIDYLAASSRELRTDRGQVLQDVLRQFELQAIGQDGMFGDDIERGGGHYKEVSKVRAFLEGYRRAEVRRISRETTTLLLDKLVSDGIDGLDMMLVSMTRSSDDTSEYAGELNDSLLEYLSDAIRQQEKKVDKLVAERLDSSNFIPPNGIAEERDNFEELWSESTEDDGKRVQSINPNDPNVQKVLKDEYEKSLLTTRKQVIPDTAPEQLLLLLSLLRDRIKAEATFAPDEKGRNLRLLAYCLRVEPDERERYILKTLGNSLDVSAHFGLFLSSF